MTFVLNDSLLNKIQSALENQEQKFVLDADISKKYLISIQNLAHP